MISAETLQGLAARLGRDQEKKFRLSLNGMAEIPANYRTTVRDLLIQLLRNSAVHGIESPEVRRQRSKAEEASCTPSSARLPKVMSSFSKTTEQVSRSRS